MTPDEFRAAGHATIEWLAGYMEEVATYPVLSRVEPGEVRGRLPASVPDTGEPFEAILADLDEIILPGLTHWQSPNFFAYFPANASPPSVLGELLSAGLGVQGMSWATSPACTELESHVLDQMIDLTGLPERFRSGGPGGGVIQDSASSATLCALLAARDRAGGAQALDRLVVYTSTQAHSSVEKGARVAGFAADQVRSIEVDSALAMRPDLLAAAIDSDIDAGRVPCIVAATIGTTSTTAIDPIPEIAEICARQRVWLHVDAAYAGSAAVCPELRWINDGVEAADSYCFNPHKWLLTNFDCTCFYVADRDALVGSLGIVPEYLRNAASESGSVTDYRDWQVPLGRRFRSLKLWFVLRSYGVEGLRSHIRTHVSLAEELADRVRDDPRFELVAPVPLGLVCVRHVSGDAATQRILDGCNSSGMLHLTHTRVGGSLVMRVAIGGVETRRSHVEAAWEQICAFAGS